MHADARIWGDSVSEFCPERFLNGPNGQVSSPGPKHDGSNENKERQKPVHPAAFRAFGGGATLCPGRHFAQAEILGFVAMVLLRFDLVSTAAGGTVQIPGKKDDVLPIHILEPKEKVMVQIGTRKGWEHVQWEMAA